MKALFLNVLDASFSGGIVIAVVLLLRQVLKRAPRSAICLLWLLAGLRLLCPFEIESSFSLQPDVDPLTSIQAGVETGAEQLPATEGVPAVPEDVVLPEDVPIVIGDQAVVEEPRRIIDWGEAAGAVWFAVAVGMALYSGAVYWKLKRRVREAVKLADNVYECAGLGTAFVLGYLKPRIYIPMGMEDPKYIVDHERAHIRRGDHWSKLLGFVVLTVHWFNPLVWVGYWLMCRDLEMACDEAVVRGMDLSQRKAYSAALLAGSAGSHSFAACPVAFGEVSVKARILGVLNYRKPRFWICLLAVVAIVFVAVCFLTSPAEPEQLPDQGDVPGWVREITAEDVASVEMTVFYSEDKPYRRFEGKDLEQIVQLLNGCNGSFVGDPELYFGGSVTLYITMADGTLHTICNSANRNLYIDGVCYDADDAWLASWPWEGEAAVPEDFDASRWEEALEARKEAEEERLTLERCRMALEELQNRESCCLMRENSNEGDLIVNDTSVSWFYRSGDDWVEKTEIDGVDQSVQVWHMAANGGNYVREVSIIHDPANGESWDSGWVREDDVSDYEPWILRLDWDASEIYLMNASDEDAVIFVVEGAPFEPASSARVSCYAVTMRFRHGTDAIESITLQYTIMSPITVNGEETVGVSNVRSVIYPQEMSGEDVRGFIGQCCREAA